MGRALAVVLFALAVLVVVSSTAISPVVTSSSVAAPAVAGAATGPIDSAEVAEEVETRDETETTSPPETTNPTEPTPTPDDGPDGHADDPFPRWLPLAFAGALAVGIAAVGGGLWVVYARVRRFLGR